MDGDKKRKRSTSSQPPSAPLSADSPSLKHSPITPLDPQLSPPPSYTPHLTQPLTKRKRGHSSSPPVQTKSFESAATSTPTDLNLCKPLPSPAYTSVPLPLTKENLHLLRAEMNPLTPDKSKSKSKSGRRTTNEATSTSKSPSLKGLLALRQLLMINNMPIEDTRVKKEKAYKDMMAFAGDIVLHKERHSPDNPGPPEKLEQIRDQYGTRNEDTFVRKYWGKLIRDEREIEITEEDVATDEVLSVEKTDLIKGAWEKQAWDVDNLDENWNQEFIKDSIPEIDTTDDPAARYILAANGRIKNPQPDIAYGLNDEAFTPAEFKMNLVYNQWAGISRGIWHPGAIVEAKVTGVVEVVECQCAKGGAALVNAMLELLHQSGADVSIPGALMKSAVFSVALVPTCANLYVHWAEIREDGSPIFHMHLVDSYALAIPTQSLRLRKSINNILDWISLTRKTWIKEILADLDSRIRAGLPTFSTIHNQPYSTSTDETDAADDVPADEDPLTVHRKGKKRKL